MRATRRRTRKSLSKARILFDLARALEANHKWPGALHVYRQAQAAAPEDSPLWELTRQRVARIEQAFEQDPHLKEVARR